MCRPRTVKSRMKATMMATITRMMNWTGKIPTWPCPMKRKGSGNPAMIQPFFMAAAIPRVMIRVPKVMIKGGTPTLVTKTPCIRPTRAEKIRTAKIAGIMPSP